MLERVPARTATGRPGDSLVINLAPQAASTHRSLFG